LTLSSLLLNREAVLLKISFLHLHSKSLLIVPPVSFSKPSHSKLTGSINIIFWSGLTSLSFYFLASR
ncbi:MAG: hypothetical protein DRJ11_07440, partial [Candidatus Aminicenantes bacterium]